MMAERQGTTGMRMYAQRWRLVSLGGRVGDGVGTGMGVVDVFVPVHTDSYVTPGLFASPGDPSRGDLVHE